MHSWKYVLFRKPSWRLGSKAEAMQPCTKPPSVFFIFFEWGHGKKVLSMGNLLNGHEPVVREIIFSLRDGMNGNHYAAHQETYEEMADLSGTT